VSGKGRARIFLFARIRKSGYFCPVVFLYVQEATRLVAISSGDLKKFSFGFLGFISPVPLFVVRAFLFLQFPRNRGN